MNKKINKSKGKMVNCLGFCNKQFFSVDPTTNRVCKKCQEKLQNKNREMGRCYFFEKKTSAD